MPIKAFLFLIAIIFFSFRVSAGANYTSNGTGGGSWTTNSSWSPSTGFPVAGDNVTILAGDVVTMNGNPGACANLTINGTASWSAARTTNVSGNLTINNGGSITGSATGTLNVTGTMSIPLGASVTIGQCKLTVSNTTTIDGALDFNSATGVKTLGDVTIDNSGTWSSSANSAITISGSLTNNGTFTSGTGAYTFSGAGKSLTGSNGLTFSGAVTMTGSYINSNSVNVTVTGNLTGAGSLTQGASSNLFLGGTSTITTLTATANPNLVNYNSAGAQTIKSTTYQNLTISNAGASTLGGSITVNGNMDVSSGTLATSTFQIIGNATGTFTLEAGVTLFVGLVASATDISFPTNFTTANISLNATSIVTYQGNNSQTISSIPTYGNLTVNTFSGSKTADGDLTVAGNLIVTSPTTLDMTSHTLNLTGTFTSTGSLFFSSGNFNIGGTYTNTGTFTSGTGTITYNGAGAQTLKGTTYYNLTITSGNTVTAGAAFTCNNNLILTSGTLASGNLIHTVFGSTTISGGTLSTSNAGGVYNLQSVSMTSGAISGSATGTVTIATTLNVPSGSPTIGRCVLTVGGTTTIDGTLDFNNTNGIKYFSDVTIDNGGTWSSSGNSSFNFSGNITNNGTLSSPGTGTYTFAGTSKSIAGSNAISMTTAAITGTYTNNDAVSLTITGVLSGSGGLTQGTSSSLFLGGSPTLTTIDASANLNIVTYNGAGAQNILAPTTSYYNLTIAKTGNTGAALGSFTVSNNLLLTAGTFASSTFTVTVSGATSISGGTMSTSNASGVYNLESVSMTSGSIAGSATGTVTIASTLNVPSGSPTIGRCVLTVSGATTIDGSLTFNNITGAKTFSDVTVDVGGTWDATAAVPFTLNGNLSNSGTFTSNTGVYTLAGGGKTLSGSSATSITNITCNGTYTNNLALTVATSLKGIGTFSQGTTGILNIAATAANFSVTTFNASASGNTVNYNLAGAQSVRVPADGAYSNLTIAGASGTKTLLGATTISGNLSISSTLDVSATNYAINLGGNWSNTGTFTPRSGTVTLNGSGAQTITKSGGETFNILTVSGSGTKTLGSAITTNGVLTINSTLDVSSSNFGITVKGNWSNNGTFVEQSGTVTFGGAAAQTVGGSTTTNFYNITQSNAAGVSLTHDQNLIGVLTISSGTFTATGHNFTLISNASGTASIAPILGGFAGNISMQRYTGTGPTDWRFLSSAVSGATIAQWAADFATEGFTGSTQPSSSFVSIYSYDETIPGVEANGYVAATNVTNSISNGKGFWVYLGPNPITYSVTGPPNTSSQSPPISYTPSSGGASNDGWNLIANPYPSAIDWNNANWTKTNVNNAIYIYNSSTGSFSSYVAGVGVNGGSEYIASQQAFWIQTNAASPVITMTESVKAATQNPTYMRKMNSPNTSRYPMAFKDFSLPLNTNTTPNSLKLIANGNGYDDETYIQFIQGATSNFDGSYDAWKMNNLNPTSPNISSVVNDTTDLSINSLPSLNSNVTVPIRITLPSGTGVITCSIRRDSLLMLPMSSCLFLEDIANGNMIDLRSNISYSFTISDTTKAPRFLLHIYAPISKQAVNTHCSNDSSGMAIAKGTGSGPWNYTWKDASGNTLRATNNSLTSDTLSHLADGVYTIQVSGGVCGTLTDTIQIKSSSTFSLASTFSNVSCYGKDDGIAAAVPSGGNTPYTYFWSNNSTTQQISNLSTGNYSVSVTDSIGCSQTQTLIISQPAPLAAGFTASIDTVDLSVNNTVSFMNTSIGAFTYYWDFGDTTFDTVQNPIHIYSSVGTYTVMLVASNSTCSDTSYKILQVINSINTGIKTAALPSSSVNVLYDKDGGIYLAFDLPQMTDVSISVYNILGEKISGENVYHIQKNRVKLDMQNSSAGVYITVVQMTGAVISKKIIIPSR